MRRDEWVDKKDDILKVIREELAKGTHLIAACETAGISYYNEYCRYLPKALRDELKGTRRGATPVSQPKEEIKKPETRIIEDGVLIKAVPFGNERDKIIKGQQIKMGLMMIMQNINKPEEYRKIVKQNLGDLHIRGFLTLEQKGRFEFCLLGIELTYKNLIE